MTKEPLTPEQRAIESTLEELRIKLGVATSFNESGDASTALQYIREIHALSYVGEKDYQKL